MTDPEERLRRKKAELRERLGPTCAQWPPQLFDEMLDELAKVTLKFDGIASVSIYDRRSTDRLVDELKSALDKSSARRESHDADEADRTRS